MSELRGKIEAGFDSLESKTWTNAYQHAQKYEQQYMAMVDECELVSDEEVSEADGDADGSDCE